MYLYLLMSNKHISLCVTTTTRLNGVSNVRLAIAKHPFYDPSTFYDVMIFALCIVRAFLRDMLHANCIHIFTKFNINNIKLASKVYIWIKLGSKGIYTLKLFWFTTGHKYTITPISVTKMANNTPTKTLFRAIWSLYFTSSVINTCA